MEARARGYVHRLEDIARKRRDPISTTKIIPSDFGIDFKWRGSVKGVGRLLYEEDSKRIFFVERLGKRNDSISAEASRLFDSFSPTNSWRVFGFEVCPPVDFELEKFKFLTGKITFHFRSRGIELLAERWGLADTILSRHTVDDWSKAVCGAEEALPEAEGLRLVGNASLPKRSLGYTLEGLVRHDPLLNRLLVLRAVHRGRPPQWTWLP